MTHSEYTVPGLLPCPFCGHPAAYLEFETGKEDGICYPACGSCGASFESAGPIGVGWYANAAEAIDTWNTRAKLTAASKYDLANDEGAWLIEMRDVPGVGNYWGDPIGRNIGFGPIENAVRFSRKADAESVIRNDPRLREATATGCRIEATEHGWIVTHPSAARMSVSAVDEEVALTAFCLSTGYAIDGISNALATGVRAAVRALVSPLLTGDEGMQRDAKAVSVPVADIVTALRQLISIENTTWPNYVRNQFAEARDVLARFDHEAYVRDMLTGVRNSAHTGRLG